ncbi:MAG: hypothetical protein GC208_09785 [Alphaproteobacteria bacterium]|nr:hypothetical protein [Alphaproteobacteria bacterium]
MALVTVPALIKARFVEDAKITPGFMDLEHRGLYAPTVRQVASLPGGFEWVMECPFVSVTEEEGAELRAFLMKLRGRVNTFRFPVPGWTGLLSGYTGAAGLVKGAGQLGTSLESDGWNPSELLLKEGDWFTVNDELKICAADVSSDGLGEAAITFEPPLRRAPADNAPFVISSPYALMAQISPAEPWSVKPSQQGRYMLRGRESLNG